MISIKQFLEQRRQGPTPEQDVVDALTQMVRVLLDAMATRMVRGKEADLRSLRRALSGLARQMERPQPAMTMLGISSDAVEALETYCQRTSDYLREQHEERQSMIAMLTDTVAELSGQTDASVARLQTIEKQVERASEIDDMRTLRANLATSLQSLRDAAAQQRSSAVATVARLQSQIALAQSRIPEDLKASVTSHPDIDVIPEASDEPVESLPASYVADFKLQRAEHVANRFGEAAKTQMLSLIAAQLKTLLGPNDRLLRWKGTSFVMFINSTEGIQDIRARLAETVATTGQQYIEVGRKSALLSVGVDWIVFPQAGRSSLEAVFTEVDAFLANTRQTSAQLLAQR
jgi:GGDEF domain-containing protein